MSPVSIAITLLLPFCLGVAILRALGLRASDDRLAWAAWSWMLGALGTGLIVFVWAWTAPDMSNAMVPQIAIVAATAMGLWAASRWSSRTTAPSRPLQPLDSQSDAKATKWERVAFALTTCFVFFVTLWRVLVGTLRPVVEDDEAHFWALKAKLLFVSGGFGDTFKAATADPTALYNADYPVLNPMLQLWSFANAGELTHVTNRLPIQVFTLALILLLAAALRRVTRPGIAALLLLAFVSCAEFQAQAARAHGDAMVALGALAAGDAWLRWRADGRAVWLRLAALSIAVLLWSKNEGLLLVAAIVGAAGLIAIRRPASLMSYLRWRRAYLWLLAPAAILAINVFVNRQFDFRNGFLAGAEREENIVGLILSQFSERAPIIASFYTFDLAFEPTHSNLLLPCALALLFLLPFLLPFAIERRSRSMALPLLVIPIFIGGQMVIFIGAPHDIHWHLTMAASRIAFQAIPLTALCIGAFDGALPRARLG